MSSSKSNNNAAAGSADEAQSLLRPTEEPLAGWDVGLTSSQGRTLCSIAALGSLAIVFWVMDSWNRTVAGSLFHTKIAEAGQDLRVHESKSFANPFLLTVFQFVFMSVVFFGVWLLHTGGIKAGDLRQASSQLVDKRLFALAGCNAFSTFWLQNLMMPSTMMSLTVFSAVRAVEIPVAAGLRSRLLGAPLGRSTIVQAGLAFAGAWLVVYSYVTIGNCLCIWYGSGVPLSGAALVLVWMLVVTVPAAHAVLEEAAIKQMNHHPFLVLGLQNLMALAMSLPFLLLAQFAGWEDVSAGFSSFLTSPEILMMVLWLCMQMCALSAARVFFTYIANSFWSVSLRALKAAFTWTSEVATIAVFAAAPGVNLVLPPHASSWSFVMLCGIGLVAMAARLDTQKDIAASGVPQAWWHGLSTKAFP